MSTESSMSVSDFDPTLLEENLSLSVEQRILLHEAAMELSREFARAGEALRSNPE